MPSFTRSSGPRLFLALPHARFGWWGAGLAAGVIALLVVLGTLVGAWITEWGWGARLALGLSGAVAVAIAISAGVIAVIAIVKGERSLLLLGPLLFGAFWVLFVLGEFLSPH